MMNRITIHASNKNTMPLPIRTAAVLGTPSKTLRSGTPEFFRGLRQFCVTVGSGSYAKIYILLPDLFQDDEAITASIDERPNKYAR
jgi:hypothetical protein